MISECPTKILHLQITLQLSHLKQSRITYLTLLENNHVLQPLFLCLVLAEPKEFCILSADSLHTRAREYVFHTLMWPDSILSLELSQSLSCFPVQALVGCKAWCSWNIFCSQDPSYIFKESDQFSLCIICHNQSDVIFGLLLLVGGFKNFSWFSNSGLSHNLPACMENP